MRHPLKMLTSETVKLSVFPTASHCLAHHRLRCEQQMRAGLAQITLSWHRTLCTKRNIQTLVLTIQVPFDIKGNRKCMFLAKEKLHEDHFLQEKGNSCCISVHSQDSQTVLKKLSGTISFRRRVTPAASQFIAKTPRLF